MRAAGLLLVSELFACTASPSNVATGQLDAWTVASDMPIPRANHCSAAIDDWILVIGGNHMVNGGFASSDEIDAARIAGDGTLGPWQVAGHTPSPVTECNATSVGRTLYLIDGIYDDDSDARGIFTATLDAQGTLSPFTNGGQLPGVAIGMEAAALDQRLVVMTTNVPGDHDSGRTAALISPVRDLTWNATDLGFGFRGQAQYAFTDHFIYTLGGYHDTQTGPLRDVSMTPLAGGTTTSTTELPQPIAFGEAVAVDDWLYIVGGRPGVFGSSGQTAVYAAGIESDGSLGSWSTTAALPMGRTNHDLTLVGDYLVLTGGAEMGPGDAHVLISRVRF